MSHQQIRIALFCAAIIIATQTNIIAMGIFNRDIYTNSDYKRKVNESTKNTPEFKKFVELFSPPADVLQTFIQNEVDIYDNKNSLDSFIIKKTDLSRIINAQRIKNYLCIKKYKHVDVAEKYIFLAGDAWKIIAKKVFLPENKIYIGIDAIKEIADVVTTLGFSDFYTDNIFVTESGKLVFIDTEDLSFTIRGNKKWMLSKIKEYFYNKLTQEAEMWLEEEYKLNKDETKKEYAGIYLMPELDTHSINIKNLYEEYNTIKQIGHAYFENIEQKKSSTLYATLPIFIIGALYFIMKTK